MKAAEARITAETLTHDELLLQVLDFIEGTQQFYLLAKDVARDYGQPLSPLIFTALNESKKTINNCLEDIGGISHYVDTRQGRVYCKFQNFEGYDFTQDQLIWQASVGQVQVGFSFIDEVRQKHISPSPW